MARHGFGVEGDRCLPSVAEGDFVTVFGCWSGRDSEERTQQEGTRSSDWREFAGTFGWPDGGRLPPPLSGREGQGAQPGQGTIELGFPRPVLWQMQCEAARRSGDPSC